ncbi:MAG: DUF1559 domain-containing protein [Planctomycetales bacterium]|nr:DUF1559 domain-containing protein [Planctomycetales bacterium]
MKSIAVLNTLLLSVLMFAQAVYADAKGDVGELVATDVVAIGYLDVAELSQSGLLNLLGSPVAKMTVPPGVAESISTVVQELHGAGVTRIYAMLRVVDIANKSPVLVVVENGSDSAKARSVVGTLLGRLAPLGVPQKVRPRGKSMLIGVSDSQLSQVEAALEKQRPSTELAQPLAQTDDSLAGLLLFGDPDSRRVLRETFPQLPPPFEAIDGRLIADEIEWGHVSLHTRQEPRVELFIKTFDQNSAQAIEQSVTAGAKLLQKQLATLLPAGDLPKDMLRPIAEDGGVKVVIAQTPQERALLASVVGGRIAEARGAGMRAQRINSAKQLALGLVNYESVAGVLCRSASYDGAGKPLLSWRVHLLPYLGEEKLYKEFHLNEPWDSPHNHPLIERMPMLFADPDPQIQNAIGNGRTTWVVPVAKETAFPALVDLPDGEPLKFSDITDGSSKTIAIVQVTPDRAVVWTKPEDWNVDMSRPLDGVLSTQCDGFVAARLDGSVQYYGKNSWTEEHWRSLLTRAANDYFSERSQ